MSQIQSLGYMVISARRPQEWLAFANDVLGAQASVDESAGTVNVRFDENEQRLQIVQGDDDFQAAGWSFASSSALRDFVAALEAQKVEVVRECKELAATRRVEEIFSCNDPDGVRHELHYGEQLAAATDPFRSSRLVGKGFVTGNLGVGHFLQVCKDRDASLDFYTSKLGLQISDYITEKDHPVPGVTAAAVFLHCANPRHHSVALAEMPTDQRVHHIMIEVETLDDVGLAYDRFLNSGTGVVLSIGRHPNDKMTSFYGRTPSGMYVEYGWGGLHIDVGSWKVKKYSKLSDWGHHPPGDALSKPL